VDTKHRARFMLSLRFKKMEAADGIHPEEKTESLMAKSFEIVSSSFCHQ
jgi:hypothetical protein